MKKIAFLILVKGTTPKTYGCVCKNEQCHSLVAGVDSMEMGKKYVMKLVERGYGIINLCSAFDEEAAAQIQQAAGDQVKVRRAKYLIDEFLKLERLRSRRNYGLIIKVDGVEKAREMVLRSDVRDTRVVFVKDMRQARNAARRFVAKRTDYFELSSWFDGLRAYSVSTAIDRALPMGTCGDLSMKDLEE